MGVAGISILREYRELPFEIKPPLPRAGCIQTRSRIQCDDDEETENTQADLGHEMKCCKNSIVLDPFSLYKTQREASCFFVPVWHRATPARLASWSNHPTPN
jgi:hypothetical protein